MNFKYSRTDELRHLHGFGEGAGQESGIYNATLRGPLSLEDPHMQFALLKSCFAFSKFAFSLHTMDTCPHYDMGLEFDDSVQKRRALEEMRQLWAPLKDSQWIPGLLPYLQGGSSAAPVRVAKFGECLH